MDHFATDAELPDGTKVKAPLDRATLQHQAHDFVLEIRHWVQQHHHQVPPTQQLTTRGSDDDSASEWEDNSDRESDGESDATGAGEAEEGAPEPTATRETEAPKESEAEKFYRSISNIPGSASFLRQWLLLAELVFVMVSGSVEEERMFSEP